MQTSEIHIAVTLDEHKIPEKIQWKASDTSADTHQEAKALMLAFWDGADKSALRMDLWTKAMMVDEMGDFFYQTLMTMADTLQRATHQPEMVADMKEYAKNFYQKFRAQQMSQNKL